MGANADSSRPLAALYKNLRQRKQPFETPEPEPVSDAAAAADPWTAWGQVAVPADEVAAPTTSETNLTLGEDAARSSAADARAQKDRSETDPASSSSQVSQARDGASVVTPASASQSLVSNATSTSAAAGGPPNSHELAVALAHVAAEPATAPAAPNLPKTPFLDDDGHPMLNYLGQPTMRSADRLDPHEMIARGEDLRQQMASSPLNTPEESAAVLLGKAYPSLFNFRSGGRWDAQRLGDTHADPALVDYANELIGMYGKAAGLPLEGDFGVLEAANIHSLRNVMLYNASPTKSPARGYQYLSVRDAEDIRIGYNSVTEDGKIMYKGPKPAQTSD